jgi:hypothetical protein
MTLEGARMMNKNMVGVSVTNDPSGVPLTVSSGEWALVAGTTNSIVQRSYFDLSGYQLEHLTTFFQGVEIQEPAPVTGDDNRNDVIEIISTEYISDAELAATIPPLSGSGFMASSLNQEQIVYGRRRIYYLDGGTVGAQIPLLQSVSMWGTCGAGTMDKLHITRVLTTTTADSNTILQDCNVVLSIIISKEKDLPFLMRQKRSYELATQG